MACARECYVRFHHLNPAGVSYNYRDDIWEKGNSVYRAVCTEHGEYYLGMYPSTSYPQTLMIQVTNHLLHGAPIFEVTGRLLEDRGSDGEPLLLDVQIVRELMMDRGVIVTK